MLSGTNLGDPEDISPENPEYVQKRSQCLYRTQENMQGEKLKRTEGQKQEWKQGGGKPRPWERMLRLTRGFG